LVDCAASGVLALPPVLLLVATHLRPTAPSVPPATFALAYCAATETPLGQKNHQKWCLGPESVDLYNLSPFQHCTRITLLPKQQIRCSESRSEEISRRLSFHAPTHASKRICQFANAPPRAIPSSGACDSRANAFHAPETLQVHEMHTPHAATNFGACITRTSIPSILQLPHVLQRAAISALSSATCQAPKKKSIMIRIQYF
jgi:hypothetical protein